MSLRRVSPGLCATQAIYDLEQQEENSPFPAIAILPCSGVLKTKTKTETKK